MAQILSGAPAAEAMLAGLSVRTRALRERGVTPTLVILRVGAQEASRSYERAAKKACTAAGVESFTIELPENAHMDAVLHAVRSINAEAGVHGALLLRPMPFKKTEQAACRELAASKDVDGVSPASLASVFTGERAGFAPCTARAVLELLDYYGIEPRGKRVAVVGRSLVVGKPLAMLLTARDATVTLCHSARRIFPASAGAATLSSLPRGSPAYWARTALRPARWWWTSARTSRPRACAGTWISRPPAALPPPSPPSPAAWAA